MERQGQIRRDEMAYKHATKHNIHVDLSSDDCCQIKLRAAALLLVAHITIRRTMILYQAKNTHVGNGCAAESRLCIPKMGER